MFEDYWVEREYSHRADRKPAIDQPAEPYMLIRGYGLSPPILGYLIFSYHPKTFDLCISIRSTPLSGN